VAVARNSKGSSLTLRWLLRDISERKRSESAMLGAEVAEAARVELEKEISMRQQVESVLFRALKEQQAIMDAILDISYVLDSDGNLLKWNKRLEVVTGLEPEVLKGKSALEFFPAAEKATIIRTIQEVFATGKGEVEAHLIGVDDVLVPYEWHGVTLKNEAGHVIGITGIARDITERKRVEQVQKQLNADLECQVQQRTAQLQQSLGFEAMLKRITDKVRDSLDESQILQITVQELVVGLGLSGCNAARYNLADRTATICYEYVTNLPSYRYRAVQMAIYPEIYHQLLAGQYFQFCSLFPNPDRGDVALLTCPIMNGEEVLGDLWLINSAEHTFSEVEIRLVQQVANQCAIAIRQARFYMAAKAQVLELEKLNQLKDEFLSTVSHELRTPMANMKMAIQMLKTSPTVERSQRYLEILQNECTREVELINDLLDLQRLETASYPNLLIEAIDLQEMLPTLIEPFRVRIGQHQQALRLSIPNSIPALISDRTSLESILAELLNNACKYTPAGGEIVLSICYESVEAATIFTVSNSVEIPADQLQRIFEKFYRIPKADPWKQGGTGLGLALVQKLVERLKATIKVESSSGWTSFTIKLLHQPKT
jgi:PAS domain S-box-containing protein